MAGNNSNSGKSQSSGNSSSRTTRPISSLIDVMKSVDTKAPKAAQNATSMEDNNGGRIEYSESILNKEF